ncbi:hypothetical protein [Bartonella sp. CB169]|uniref:hypothetical protein n=1 Tax=Bartonella sp. CB169 TaxID=3112257 RepID=UPI00300DE470
MSCRLGGMGGIWNGSAMEGVGGGIGSSMGKGGVNASQMTGNPFKNSDSKSQYSNKNPRITGDARASTETRQSKMSSASQGIGSAANAALKTAGVLAAISVHGMEDTANLELSAPPISLEDNDMQDFNISNPQTEISEAFASFFGIFKMRVHDL